MGINKDRKHLEEKDLGRYNQRKYKDALDQINLLEKELDTYQILSQAPYKRKICKRDTRKSKTRSQATVIAVASDWHIDEIVKPASVQNRNSYNPDIAVRRSDTFFRSLVRLTEKERQDVHITDLVLYLLGDFISGAIHEELLENTSLRPLEAMLLVEELLNSGLQYIKDHGNFKNIVVVTADGNHSRINHGKIKHQSRHGHSLEWAMYHTLAKKHPDINWVIEESYLTYYQVYGYTIRSHHGDAIRYNGGVGGPMVPIVRSNYQWNVTQRADFSIMGHLHTYIPGAKYNGGCMVNGSLIGYNAFAQKMKIAGEAPQQIFALIDSKRGLTVQMPILVDMGSTIPSKKRR